MRVVDTSLNTSPQAVSIPEILNLPVLNGNIAYGLSIFIRTLVSNNIGLRTVNKLLHHAIQRHLFNYPAVKSGVVT